MESTILQGLNKAQYDAVVNYEKPSLIIAGAGSGKTRVLTSRIAYMLEQGVKPWNILALTFTNKAAEQMRSRIEQMVGSEARYIRMGTFHSVFSRILRENAERIGYPQSYTIYEPNDCKNLIKTICKEMGLISSSKNENESKSNGPYKPINLLSRISFAKNCLITPGAYAATDTYIAEDRMANRPRFSEIYTEYCRRCKQNGAMDFDDLLLQTNILLRDCPDVLEKYQRLFEYILVDEYQDTNKAQYIIIRRLSQLHGRVCVVGDDAQSIYSFRGAKIENILSFRNDYPQALTFKLEQNYRSTQTIVNAANSVIERNSRRMDKKCFSAGDSGDKIRIIRSYTDREEADDIANLMRTRLRNTGDSWSEVAVLYRTNSQSAVMEKALFNRGIPYRVYKGHSFYDSKEIRDMLAYFRLIVNPKDNEALKRIINYPMRGIGDTTVNRIAELSYSRGQSMWEAIDTLVAEAATLGDPMQKTIARKVTEFVNMIRSFQEVLQEKAFFDFGLEVASRTGILASYRNENTHEAERAIENIESLLNSMKVFEEKYYNEKEEQKNIEEEDTTENDNTTDEVDAAEENAYFEENEDTDNTTDEEIADIKKEILCGWLQEISLITDMDNKEEEGSDDKVTLMTVHSAKGLEYKYIYIVGCEERLFPSERAMESPDGLEEERRLFYVALTRAKAEATLSYCEMRFKWGNMEFSSPSRFLQEIDTQYVDCDEDLRRPQRRNTGDCDTDGELTGRMGNFSRGGYGSNYGGYGSGSTTRGGAKGQGAQRNDEGKTAIEELRKRFDYRFQKEHTERTAGVKQSPDPRIVQQPTAQRSTEGMRRIVNKPSAAGSAAPLGPCNYEVGNRVEHPKFGVGIVARIEPMAEDYKLVVDFGQYGEKTLLAKFAKLTKL